MEDKDFMITSKDDLMQVLKDLKAKNSELSERLDNMTPEPEEKPEEKPEEVKRTDEELDEIEKLLSE